MKVTFFCSYTYSSRVPGKAQGINDWRGNTPKLIDGKRGERFPKSGLIDELKLFAIGLQVNPCCVDGKYFWLIISGLYPPMTPG